MIRTAMGAFCVALSCSSFATILSFVPNDQLGEVDQIEELRRQEQGIRRESTGDFHVDWSFNAIRNSLKMLSAFFVRAAQEEVCTSPFAFQTTHA